MISLLIKGWKVLKKICNNQIKNLDGEKKFRRMELMRSTQNNGCKLWPRDLPPFCYILFYYVTRYKYLLGQTLTVLKLWPRAIFPLLLPVVLTLFLVPWFIPQDDSYLLFHTFPEPLTWWTRKSKHCVNTELKVWLAYSFSFTKMTRCKIRTGAWFLVLCPHVLKGVPLPFSHFQALTKIYSSLLIFSIIHFNEATSLLRIVIFSKNSHNKCIMKLEAPYWMTLPSDQLIDDMFKNTFEARISIVFVTLL